MEEIKSPPRELATDSAGGPSEPARRIRIVARLPGPPLLVTTVGGRRASAGADRGEPREIDAEGPAATNRVTGWSNRRRRSNRGWGGLAFRKRGLCRSAECSRDRRGQAAHHFHLGVPPQAEGKLSPRQPVRARTQRKAQGWSRSEAWLDSRIRQ